jgi:hypothetical protein
MSTTAIFAELLVVGLLALLGVAVVLAGLFGIPTGTVGLLKDIVIPGALAVLAVAYPVGIGVDRIADSIGKRLDERWFVPSLPIPEEEMRFRVWGKSQARLIDFLDYARSRRRVARATSLLAIPVCLVLFGYCYWGGWTDFWIACGVLALFALSLNAWWRIGKMYYSRLHLAYRVDILGEPLGTGAAIRD